MIDIVKNDEKVTIDGNRKYTLKKNVATPESFSTGISPRETTVRLRTGVST